MELTDDRALFGEATVNTLILGGDPDHFVSTESIVDELDCVIRSDAAKIYMGPASETVWGAVDAFATQQSLPSPRPMDDAAGPFELVLVFPPLTHEGMKVVEATMKNGTNTLYLYESSDFEPAN